MSRIRLIVGCGYLGGRVARLWREAGDEVWATTRTLARAEALRAEGLRPIIWDIAQPQAWPELPPADSVLFSVGHDRRSGVDMRAVLVDGLRRALDALPDAARRVVHISSTGVYGQTDGQVVNENSPTEPSRPGGRICLEAERALQSHRVADRAVILRLAGIYGPGRVPRLDAIRAGEPLALPTEGYLNLIHVEDAARIVLLAADQARSPRTFLVSDGHPVNRRTYYKEVARRLGAPAPTFAPAGESPAAARAESSKRLDIRRLLTELPLTLRYPNYRHGLKAILGQHVQHAASARQF